ncbi:hypothetical protein CSC82_01805 [Rhodobacteraceae bacterium 4F10]|nr:hypothetical protein CSC82_01805 [Rhodobacteraceae bacterium 4F10]
MTIETVLTDDQVEKNLAIRTIARVMWAEYFKAENPEAAQDEINEAWDKAKEGEKLKARKALKALEQRGFVLVSEG